MKSVVLFAIVWLICGLVAYELIHIGHWILGTILIVVLLCGTSIDND